MTPRLSGHFSTFGLVFFVLKSLLGIARQWSERFAILTLKPRSHARILIYRTWAIANLETVHGTDSGCVELQYGIVLKTRSVLLLAFTNLLWKLAQHSSPKTIPRCNSTLHRSSPTPKKTNL